MRKAAFSVQSDQPTSFNQLAYSLRAVTAQQSFLGLLEMIGAFSMVAVADVLDNVGQLGVDTSELLSTSGTGYSGRAYFFWLPITLLGSMSSESLNENNR